MRREQRSKDKAGAGSQLPVISFLGVWSSCLEMTRADLPQIARSPSNLTHCLTVPGTLTASRCSVLFFLRFISRLRLPPVLNLGSPVSSGS